MPQASLDLSSMSFAIAPSTRYALLLLIFFSVMTSFAPGNVSRTTLAVLISGSPLLVIASRYTLKGRMHALDSVLSSAKDLLADAQASSALGAQPYLLFEMTRLQRAEILRSDAFCSILDLCNCPWGSYTRESFRLWRAIANYKREAKDIRKTIRKIIEDDRKQKLEREIQNTQGEIANLRSRCYSTGSRSFRRFPTHSPAFDA
ncbi:hypothetical protein C8F01DRAFT_1265638 [Mycena amicta]|nr:hypothetical protein C8F01DRAFT_1265638 [Mycena amicta]